MPIRLITDKNKWLGLTPDAPFSQSWEWGEILASEGKRVEMLEIGPDTTDAYALLVVYANIPIIGQYAFCPKGPKLNPEDGTGRMEELKKYFSKRNCVFFRFEPPVADEGNLSTRKTIDINPRATLILDLSDSENGLLAAMHPKTRYNIGLAEKKGLVTNTEKNWDVFWKLMRLTGERNKFGLHIREHYQAVLKNTAASQLTAFFNNEPVATAVLIGSGKTLTYLYGASDYRYRHLMAPYLLQWEAIKFARANGYQFYDFFGVAPNIGDSKDYVFDRRHQYAGVTRFKLGFGGRYEEAPGTFDLIIDKKRYLMYKIIRTVRRVF